MKKITTVLLFAFMANVTIFAQATLPDTCSFVGTTVPTGWVWTTTNLTPYYPASGNPAPAAKFSLSGDMLTISFTTTPGLLSYDIAGNNVGSAWTGDFRVEESVNGTTYTTVGTAYTSITATGPYVHHTAMLTGASRFVRFHMITHTAGNIGLDNVGIRAGVSTTQQMNVTQSGNTILNGGSFVAGVAVLTPLPITFTVQNLGTVGTLNVTGATLSGPAMADYAITSSFPFAVAPVGNAPLAITFTPSAAGTRSAILTIANDDPTANPYIINLNCMGGTSATEPTAQPTALTFPVNKSYRIIGNFTAAAGTPDGYLILRKTGSAPTDLPVDGTVYTRGDMIGTSKVVASNAATGFMPNDIKSSTQYFFAIYSYNGVGTFRNYLTTSPLTGSVTTSGTMMPAAFYSSISTSTPTFVTDLHNLVNPHNIELYSNYGPFMMNFLYQRDTTGGAHVATCSYSGENITYIGTFDWTTNNMSREHTYCQSWQPTVNDPNFTSRGEYNDYHMITPVDQNNVNAIRSNYPLGIVVGTPTYSYMGCKKGLDAAGHMVFEPRDSDKGDAARCMLYQCICYTGTGTNGNTDATYGGSWSLPNHISAAIPFGQNQNVLKTWNILDPPDKFEISRNDFVDSLQNNRNPFIDHPEYVCHINFDSMTYSAADNCTGLGIYENTSASADLISISPNPSNGNFMINYTSAKAEKVSMKLVDMLGRIVYVNDTKVNSGVNQMEILLQNVNKGMYSLEFITENGKQTQRVIIQ